MSKKPNSTKASMEATFRDPSAWARTLRETVESVAIAFILAFMFRTFEAEAFVIPTGSMAPTLQGRHKDIVCPQCGYQYRVGASGEVDRESSEFKQQCAMKTATCPMCRYTADVDDPQNRSQFPSYNGDRIIVNKFAYDVSDPQRWDVIVFKYPENSKENYIKRLIGLPNERIRLHWGDVYVAPLGSDNFQIARKPPEKLRETLLPVYDNDYVVPKLIEAGMPPRWQPWAAPGTASTWKVSDDFKSFSTDGSVATRAWIRYQNLLPDDAIWEAVQHGRPFQSPQPTLIHDFYAYNDGDFPPGCNPGPTPEVPVGDLAIDCTLNVKTAKGGVILELVKGGLQYRCQIDLSTGDAKLSISGQQDFAPAAKTSIHTPGKYDLRFTNVDKQLLLWVNNTLIAFDAPTTYDHPDSFQPVRQRPVPGLEQATDLSPVGIAADGGADIDVSHLNLRRDIYYVSQDDNVDSRLKLSSIDLQSDQFFMCGDNSPESSDGRYWRNQNFVDRRLLIGKALFVYWPHSFNYLEISDKKIPFPYWPNFSAMRFVH
jgi:signal peptidase I